MCGGGTSTQLPTGCGTLCGAKTPYSKRGLAAAIRDGDLSGPEGRCVYCGALAQIEKGAPQPKTATGPKCSCWRTAVARCPKHGAQPTPARVGKQSAPELKKERVELPYKKQTCAVVVQVGPLELVYPALVSEEKEPRSAASPLKEDEYVPMGLTLAEAPEWLAYPLECRPYTNAAPAAKPVSQREEFALIKRRLVKLGKEKMRLAYRKRQDKLVAEKKARAAYQRKYDALLPLVREARAHIECEQIIRDLRATERQPLTPAQHELVSKSCRLAGEERASMEAFLLGAKARRHRVCPHVAPREEIESPRVVPSCTTPWSGLGMTLTSLRDGGSSDATLGVKSLASRQGDYTCNSALGFPTKSYAVAIMASSLERARKVVRATINFARGVKTLPRKMLEVASKIKTKVLSVQQKVAPEVVDKCTIVPDIGQVPQEVVVKQTNWNGIQLPEMGVRNIYAFHDDSWSASPEEDEKYTIPWSNRCGPCVHAVIPTTKVPYDDCWYMASSCRTVRQ
nr:hypothetical protein (HP) [Grapevine Bulgarian latent virus]